MLRFPFQLIIHSVGQRIFQTLRFMISGAKDIDYQGVDIRDKQKDKQSKVQYFRSAWLLYGVGLFLLNLIAVSFNSIFSNVVLVYTFLIFSVGLTVGIFTMNVVKGKHTWVSRLVSAFAWAAGAITLLALRIVAEVGDSLWPIGSIVIGAILLFTWASKPWASSKIWQLKLDNRVISTLSRSFILSLSTLLWFFWTPIYRIVNLEGPGESIIMLFTHDLALYSGAILASIFIYYGLGRLTEYVDYLRFLRRAKALEADFWRKYFRMNAYNASRIFNLFDEVRSSLEEGSQHYAQQYLGKIKKYLNGRLDPPAEADVPLTRKSGGSYIGGPSLTSYAVSQGAAQADRQIMDWKDALEKKFNARTMQWGKEGFAAGLGLLHQGEEDTGFSLIHPFQIRIAGSFHPMFPQAIANRLDQGGYVIDVASQEEAIEIIKAWQLRRWIMSKMTPGGNSYPTAINLFEQALALEQEGIAHQRVLYIASNKFDAKSVAPSLIPLGNKSEFIQRMKLAGLMMIFTRVKAMVVHTRTAFGFKSAAMTGMTLDADAPYLNDQYIVDDKSTTVYDLDAFAADQRDFLNNPNLISKVPLRAPQNTLTRVGDAVGYIERGHGMNLVGTMVLGGSAGESISTGWGNGQEMVYSDATEAFRKNYQLYPVTSRYEQGSFANNFGLRIFSGNQDYNISEDLGTIVKATYMKISSKGVDGNPYPASLPTENKPDMASAEAELQIIHRAFGGQDVLSAQGITLDKTNAVISPSLAAPAEVRGGVLYVNPNTLRGPPGQLRVIFEGHELYHLLGKNEQEARNLTLKYLPERNLLNSHIVFLQINAIGLIPDKDWLQSLLSSANSSSPIWNKTVTIQEHDLSSSPANGISDER